MATYREALRLQAEAAAAVTAAGLDDVLVTLDDTAAGAALEGGVAVVLITPPRVEYEGGSALDVAAWTVYAIASEFTDPQAYWPRLDALTDALTDTFQPDASEPVLWRTAGPAYPARQITFTT